MRCHIYFVELVREVHAASAVKSIHGNDAKRHRTIGEVAYAFYLVLDWSGIAQLLVRPALAGPRKLIPGIRFLVDGHYPNCWLSKQARNVVSPNQT